jgi:hypothetical protein
VSERNACFGNGNWNPVRPRAIVASMAGYVVIRITERLGGGEPRMLLLNPISTERSLYSS